MSGWECRFQGFLQTLMYSQLPHLRRDDSNPEIDADTLYKQIIPQVYALNQQSQDQQSRVQEIQPPEVTTSGQLAGTCSQRALQQYIKQAFDTLGEYQRFIFHYKLYIFKNYINNALPQEQMPQVMVEQQLAHARDELLRILNLPGLFSNSDKKMLWQQIDDCYQKWLDYVKVIEGAPGLEENSDDHHEKLDLPKGTFKKVLPNSSTPRKQLPQFQTINTNNYLIKELKRIKQHIDNLLNKQPREDEFAYRQIEYLFLSLPLEAHHDWYQSITNQNKLDTLLETINQLQDLQTTAMSPYSRTQNSALGRRVTRFQPRTLLVHMHLLAVIDTLEAKIHKSNRTQAYQAWIKQFLARNAYLNTKDRSLDQYYEQLHALYGNNRGDLQDNMLDEYFRALDKHPELTNQLADKFRELHKERKQQLNIYIKNKTPQQKQQHKALYVWFINDINVAQKSKFRPICREIEQVQRLDRVLVGRKYACLYFDPYDDGWNSPSTRTTCQAVISYCQQLQYHYLRASRDESYINAFIGDQNKNLSRIQIDDDQPFEEKNFYHLRCSPSNQIPLTLDYYSSHLDLLADKKHQQNLEANFFEPSLLKATLNQDDHFLQRFDDFITKGLNFFSNDGQSASQSSLLFVHINYLVSQYAADLDRDRYSKRLETLVQTIQNLINYNQDDQIKSTLYRYQFLTLFKLQQITPGDPDVYSLQQLLMAHHYYAIIVNEAQTRDQSSTFNWFLIKNEFEHFLFKNKRIIEKNKQVLIPGILTNIYPDQFPEQLYAKANLNIQGQFPYFKLPSQDMILDVSRGVLIHHKGMTYLPLSPIIRNNPDIKALGKPNYAYQCLNNNFRVVLGLKDPEERSMIYATYQGNELVLQRQFRVDDAMEWYQSQPQSILEQLLTGYPDYGLAAACMGDTIKLWYAQNQKDAIITHHQRPIYHIDSRNNSIRPIESGKFSNFQLKPLPGKLRKLFANVEQQQFTLYLEAASGDYKVALPRYGIHFKGERNNNLLTLVLDDMPDYQVEFDTKPLGLDVLGLTLIHKAHHNRFVWLPVQSFAPDLEQRDDGFYHLKQILTSSNSQYGIQLALDQNGQPIPVNTSQALYVAYLYLGQYKVDKAKQMLNYCQNVLGGIQGTPDDMLYLTWIVDLSSPKTQPFVACQLQALSLLTDYLKQGYQPPQSTDNNSDQQPIEKLANNDNLANTIMPLYQRYQSLKEHGHYAYQLAPKQRLSLLSFLQKNSQSFSGPPAVEHSRLYLALYKQEYNHLKRLDEQRVLSSKLDSRLKFLEQFLAQNQAINTHQGYLEQQAVYLSNDSKLPSNRVIFPFSQTINSQKTFFKSASNNERDRQIQKHINDMIKLFLLNGKWLLLNDKQLPYADHKNANSALLSTREVDFFYRLPEYYAVALGLAKDDALKTNLQWYCRSRLLSHLETSGEDRVTGLCRLLDRLLNANDEAKKEVVEQTKKTIGAARNRSENNLDDNLGSIVPAIRGTQAPSVEIDKMQFQPESLTDTQSIIHSLTDEPLYVELMTAEMPNKDNITSHGVEQTLRSCHTAELRSIHDFYKQVQKQVNELNDNIDKQRQNLNTEEAEFKTAELEAGQSMLSHYSQLKEQAAQVITNNSCQALNNLAEQQKTDCQKQLDQFWDGIVQLANKPPQNESKRIEHQLAIAVKAKAPIDEALLFRLYFSADKAAYRQATHLSDDDIQSLHNQLAVYVQLKTYQQHWQRIQEAVTSFYNRSEQDQDQACYELAQVLSASNQVDPYTEPKLALFQMQENVLLYPQQKAALNRLLHNMQPTPQKTELSRFLQNLLPKNKSNSNPLLQNSELTSVAYNGYQETVEKIIMGGGKSKVLLPSLAQKKATGLNLTVVEVPKALLNTNFVDLHNTSYKLFGQEAVKFEFDRNSDCSPKQLEVLYDRLYQVMINRDYLVTTGEAIQSLELKYIELLTSGPPTNKKLQWEKQVRFLNDLVCLFRNRADGVIDEVHQGLLLKRKLNYTTGQSNQLPQAVIEDVLALYRFMANIKPEQGEPSLRELLLNNQGLDNDTWLKYQAPLARELVENQDSPLQPIIQQCLANQNGSDYTAQKHLIGYLQDQIDEVPEAINKLNAENKDTIALYKQQISVILPQTLNRRLGEHYGPSKDTAKSIVKRMEAIPYSANEVPRENSRFGHPLELLNYTIQSLTIREVNTELLSQWIEQLQNKARQECWFYQGRPFNQTQAARLFSKLTGGVLDLMAIDLHSPTHMKGILQLLTDNQAVTEHILKSLVLPAIELEAGYYHSDAMNHVDMYRSVQGFSGTPWNASTFHSRLSYDAQAALGNDGYVISLIQSKQPAIQGADMNDLYDYTSHLVSDPKTRAVIDISAIFRGHSNDEVARALVQALHQNKQQQQMEYVLYFNESDVLCALSLHDPQSPIEIGSSEEANIRKKLGCGPDKRLTYYDQAHTIGADIKQQTDAHACVLIDNQTKIDDYLQGTMRMRGLHDKQTIDIVVPTSLQEQSLQTLIDKMRANQAQALIQDNYNATLAEMANTVRNEILHQVLECPKIRQKRNIMKAFQQYFVKSNELDLFNQYGGVASLQQTDTLLRIYRDQLLDDFENMKSNLRIQDLELPSANELQTKLDTIIQQRRSLCADNYPSQSRHQSVEVELQQEQYQQLEKQQEEEQRLEKAPKTPGHYISWPDDIWGLDFNAHRSLHFKSLNELIKTCSDRKYINFDDHFLLTQNFYRNATSQTSYLDSYLKPLHALMFRLKNNKLECVGLTTGELEELFIKASDGIWFTTIRGDPLAKSAKPTLSAEHETLYQKLLEQAQYVAGDWCYLAQKSTYYWLNDHFQSKKTFFETYLGKSRHYNTRLLEDLGKKLQGMAVVGNRPQNVSIMQSPHHNQLEHQQANAHDELYRACKNEQTELVKLLLDQFNNTRPELKHTDYKTALHMAINTGRQAILKALLDAGADPNAKYDYSQTILHIACQKQDLDKITQLLIAGANQDSLDNYNNKPLDYVNDNETIKQFLQIVYAMDQAINNVRIQNGYTGQAKRNELERFKQNFLKGPDEAKRYKIAQDFAKKAQKKRINPLGQASSFTAFIDSLPQEPWCDQLKNPSQVNNQSQYYRSSSRFTLFGGSQTGESASKAISQKPRPNHKQTRYN